MTVAKHVQGQLRRHVVVKELASQWEAGRHASVDSWANLFSTAQPGAANFSLATIHQYANNLRAWMIFAGLLEYEGRWLKRPLASGSQMGVVESKRRAKGNFLGSGTPAGLEKMLASLVSSGGVSKAHDLESHGYRNVLSDAIALGLVNRAGQKVELRPSLNTESKAISSAKEAVAFQPTVRAFVDGANEGITDMESLGRCVEQVVGGTWQPASAKRYANGIKQYVDWAIEYIQRFPGTGDAIGV